MKSWVWTQRQQKVFHIAMSLLKAGRVCVHYDPSLPIAVTCDTSPYGIGVVLSDVLADGSDQPVAFASSTQLPAKKIIQNWTRKA